MKDVLMEIVWKRREQMLRDHGGMEGLLKHIQKLEAEQARRGKLITKPSRLKPKVTTTAKRKANSSK